MDSQSTFLFLIYFSLNELWPLYWKDVNQIALNHTIVYNLVLQIFEVFLWILLNANLPSNQTLLAFLLYARQTWMTPLLLAISLWGVIFLHFERVLLLIWTVLQFMWRKTSFYTRHSSRKLCRFLLMIVTGFTSFDVLLLFPLFITFFVLMLSLWSSFI